MGAGSHFEDERRRYHPLARCITMAIFMALLVGLLVGCTSQPQFWPPEFWVKLPAVEGLDRASDAVRAPVFNITLRVNREGARSGRPICGGGRAVVAYAGVPLAHGGVPEFCVPPGVVGSVPIVATSDGLGLPDELYDRMQSQRRREARVDLAVQVTLDKITGWDEPLLLWCTAVLHGQPRGPFLCPVLDADGHPWKSPAREHIFVV